MTVNLDKARWVQFLEDKQVNVDGELKSFKSGDKVSFDGKFCDALITLGHVKEAQAPEDDDDPENYFKNGFKSLGEKIEDFVGTALKKGFEDGTKTFNDGIEVTLDNFAKPKRENYDLETEYGFKSSDHYFQCVREASKESGSVDYNKPGMGAFQTGVKAPTGQNISSDSEGNFLVPEPISNRIWTNVQDDPFSIFARTNQFTTAGHSLKIPRIFEPSRKNGVGQRNAGYVHYWMDEADTIDVSKMTVGKLELGLYKHGVITYATEEMLDDTGFDITGKFGELAVKAIRDGENEAFVDGSGVGKPKGFLKDDALVVVPLESGQGNHTILHHNINKMYWLNRNRSSAIWLGHPDAISRLEFMYFNDDSGNQRPIYFPANLTNTPFGTMYGRPVIPFEFMPDFGSEGDLSFVDFSQYATLTKAGQRVKRARSIHVRFLHGETAFRWVTRVDGRGLWTSAVEDKNGTTKRSWCTAMPKRTGGTSSSGL